MLRRHPLPRVWLMTDERLGDDLLRTVHRLPLGSGIVFRHYGLNVADRLTLFERVKALALKRQSMLLLAGSAALAKVWGADGSHGLGGPTGGRFRSAPVHDLSEIRLAERAGASLLFLSPVYPTRSHPGGDVLGPARFSLLTRATMSPVVALGGMSRRRAASIGVERWAAIDGLHPAQKRKAVPR
jgi:thiamine-phosphate pyrophosphorylase